MAVKTTRTATEEQLPTREEAEAAFALALDARQERVRAALNKLASDPPQVLILEGGSVAERFSVALWHAARLNCPEGRPACIARPASRAARICFTTCMCWTGAKAPSRSKPSAN